VTEPLDPERLEKIEFSAVRRGIDPAEVRSALAEAADGLRLLQRRCHELEHEVEKLRQQVPDPDDLEVERSAARSDGRSAGEAEATGLLTAARAEAETVIDAAKDEGRHLVNEAKTVRRRMLDDLARRRRALRQQIEQLQAGRERLLEAYEVVGHTMRDATEELTAALPEARAAAERAVHRAAPEETPEQLEAEIAAARLAGLPIVDEAPTRPAEEPTGSRRRPTPVPLERDVRDMPEVEPVLAEFEGVRVIDDDDDDDGDEDDGDGDDGDGDDGGATDPEAEAAEEPPQDTSSDATKARVTVVDVDEDDGDAAEPGSAADAGLDADADADAEPEDDGATDVDGGSPAVGEGTAPESSEDAADPEEDASDSDDSDSDSEGDGDLFDRLRQARSDNEEAELATVDETVALEPAEDGSGPTETAAAEDVAAVDPPVAGSDGGADDDGFDHPDDAGEPFGLALGVDVDTSESGEDERRVSAEHELGRRLKRLLSDEENDVLDRLRRTRKRSLELEDVLGDLDERVGRFAPAVQPVLASAAQDELGEEAGPVDDLAAELAREVAEALADGVVEFLEEERPVDELADPVRSLYREWKTARIGTLAHRYIEAACAGIPASE
jgi:cell division septum initiation protein DivIVA